ncbi:MAG: hypothetical protein J6R79_05540 [Bacteroidaceae bacterium]|nr:hypothetical protein [Bacteroidaceae bacterium]
MFKKIVNHLMFKPTTLFVAMTFLFMSVTLPTNAQSVVLKAGTLINLELTETLKSNKVKNGEVVNFRVTHDVKVDDKVVIPAGSLAKGQITDRKSSTLLGIPGEVSVTVKSITTSDGTLVPLSGNSLSDEGQNKLAISLVVTFLCIFGFLIKGGQGELSAGSTIQAYVAANTQVNV